jgi:glyoxylase-like metal-dependent hydrolase (beta-lactamase superfamily II)
MNLFCGDAASDYLRILGTKYAPPFVTDLNRMYETWQKFIDSGVKVLYPSHGKPIKIDKLKKNIHKLRIEKMGEFVWS